MTIFSYISRRPKVFNRPKKRLYALQQPSNLSWKRPPRGKPRLVKVQRFVDRRRKLRYQPNPPQPSNLVIKRWPQRWLKPRLRVIKFWDRRRKLRYQPNPPQPSNLVIKLWPRRWLKPRLRVLKFWDRRRKLWYQPNPPQPSSFVFKALRRFRLRKFKLQRRKIGAVFPQQQLLFAPRRRAKARKRPLVMHRRIGPVQVIQQAPVGFVAFKKPPRAKVRRWRRLKRRQLFPILPSISTLFAKFKRPKIHRNLLRPVLKRKLFPVQAAPMTVAAAGQASLLIFKPRRLRRFRKSLNPILQAVPTLFAPRKLRKLRKRLAIRKLKLNPVQAAPMVAAAAGQTSLLVFKPRRPRLLRRVRYPISLAAAVLFAPRRRRKFRKRLLVRRPKLNPGQAGALLTFVTGEVAPFIFNLRRLKLLRRSSYPILPVIPTLFAPRKRRKFKKRFPVRRLKLNPVQNAPIGFFPWKRPPRAKVRRWKSSLRRFKIRQYSLAGPPTNFVQFKLAPKFKIKRRKVGAPAKRVKMYVIPGIPVIALVEYNAYMFNISFGRLSGM